jgi:hypothetical protein
MSLKNIKATTEDSWVELGKESYSIDHYHLNEVKHVQSYPDSMAAKAVFQNIYMFDSHAQVLKRTSYNLFDLVGDLGGVF